MEIILDEQPTNEQEIVYAGFWRRFAAAFLDGIIMYFFSMLLLGIFGIAAMNPSDFSDPEALGAFASNLGIYYGVSIGSTWLYHAFMESSTYQASLGKMALGIKVASADSLGRPSFGQATGRYFGKLVSSLILGIGYLMMLWNPRSQTLHDSMSGCVVIRK